MANLIKSIYTGQNVTAIGELTSSDNVTVPGSLGTDGTLTIGSGGTVLTYNAGNSNLEFSTEISLSSAVMSGSLKGPASFIIDPAAHGDDTGTVVIAGNLQVDGTTTTVNSTTLTIEDKNITLAQNAADSAAADGAGLTIAGAGVTFNYNDSLTSLVASSDIYINNTTSIATSLNNLNTSVSNAASTGKAIAMSIVFG